MEKIYLKPESREILIKGGPADGHLDAFSYDPAGDENAKRLGSLFVVGHVHHDTDDVAYSVNLIAALAKREYYAVPGLAPREAFARTLKKVNEVVEDFFEHEGLTVNIGMFAVAGEQIYLSRLGKFKLLLARDERVIDVFNNVDLFDKEQTEQKKFSSVVSGKVLAKDRLLAFYPNRPLVARERHLKDYLVKLGPAEFADKLQEIKAGKADFACAAVHINLHKVTEIASAPAIQPQELKPVPEAKSEAIETVPVEPVPLKPLNPVNPAAPASVEMPRIISTEFSLGKKVANWQTFMRRSGVNLRGLSRRTAMILVATVAVVVAGGGLLTRNLWLTSPETRAAQETLGRARTAFESAQASIAQSNIREARQLLSQALAEVDGAAQNDKTRGQSEDLTASIIQAFDGLDGAQEVVPSLVYQVSPELGVGSLIAAGEKLFIHIQTDTGSRLAVIASGSLEKTYDLGSVRATRLFTDEGTWGAVDTNTGSLAALDGERVKSFEVPGLTDARDFNLYGTNLYLLTPDGIGRVADATLGKQESSSWLAADVVLPADSIFMTIDGSIYVLAKDGTLAIYYRGKKTGEFKTDLVPQPGDLFITSAESQPLYLVDRTINRLYVIDKSTGTISKTLKISGDNTIVSAAADPQGAVYILTKDNKVWKI